MKVCPACGKKYQDEANFCPRATCASAGRPRRLSPVGLEIPEVARRLMKQFPHKPGADDSPERLKAISRERPNQSEEVALKKYLARLALLDENRLRASDATVDFLRFLLPESSRHRPQAGERLREWDGRTAVPIELQNIRHRAYAAIRSHLQERQESDGRRKTRATRTATATRTGELRFQSYFEARKPRGEARDPAALKNMTATQLALHLAGLLRSAGVDDVSSWPITGPQGADLLFSWQGKKVVVQAKGPDAPLSSRIVRQAQAAQASYGCQAVWVVAGAPFAPAVRTLASEAGILLLGGRPDGPARANGRPAAPGADHDDPTPVGHSRGNLAGRRRPERAGPWGWLPMWPGRARHTFFLERQGSCRFSGREGDDDQDGGGSTTG